MCVFYTDEPSVRSLPLLPEIEPTQSQSRTLTFIPANPNLATPYPKILTLPPPPDPDLQPPPQFASFDKSLALQDDVHLDPRPSPPLGFQFDLIQLGELFLDGEFSLREEPFGFSLEVRIPQHDP